MVVFVVAAGFVFTLLSVAAAVGAGLFVAGVGTAGLLGSGRAALTRAAGTAAGRFQSRCQRRCGHGRGRAASFQRRVVTALAHFAPQLVLLQQRFVLKQL